MRLTPFVFLVLLIVGCSSPEQAESTTDTMTVSGEFLFEGPNTLQGEPAFRLAQLAQQLGTTEDKIKSVTVNQTQLTFESDSIQANIESALVQLVSDQLELVSIATKSPIPGSGAVGMEVNSEQDILPYLKDASSTLVVDVNIKGDMDFLEAKVDFNLTISYSK